MAGDGDKVQGALTGAAVGAIAGTYLGRTNQPGKCYYRDVNGNRFIADFYDVIAMIFHYHYQWNKHDERQRNEVAIREHLTYIDALLSRNPAMVELACRAHLASARETLLRSTGAR